MAKKTKKEVVTEEVTQVVEQPKIVVKEKPVPTPTKETWEIKDRMYRLKGSKKPLSRMIKSANIYYFDEEKVTKENLSIVKIKKRYL